MIVYVADSGAYRTGGRYFGTISSTSRKHAVMKILVTPALLFLMFGSTPLVAQQRPIAGPVQDLRETIEFERIGQYQLGPTGAKGWMHVSKNFMTGEARQILVTEIESGTPCGRRPAGWGI